MFDGTSTRAEPYGARESERALLMILDDFHDKRVFSDPEGGGKAQSLQFGDSNSAIVCVRGGG